MSNEKTHKEISPEDFDTFASCQGCPMREEGCHSRCFGYAHRSAMDRLRREKRALEAAAHPKPSEGEIKRRAKRLKQGMRRSK